MRPRRGPAGLGIDVVAILVFCVLGRRSHDEGITDTGLADTAWPFLSGTAVGWVASRAWLRPTDVAPTGVTASASTVLIGMLQCKATSTSVAAAFVVVASTVTAVFLLGWRAVFQLAARR